MEAMCFGDGRELGWGYAWNVSGQTGVCLKKGFVLHQEHIDYTTHRGVKEQIENFKRSFLQIFDLDHT